MHPSRPNRYPTHPHNNENIPPYHPNPLLPPPSPWDIPPPHFLHEFHTTNPSFPPPRPARPNHRRARHSPHHHQHEAPLGRGAAAAGRWEPPPPQYQEHRHEQPRPRPQQGHGAQRGVLRETGGFPGPRMVEQGPRLRFANITNIRVVLPVLKVVPRTQQDASTQCNRPWKEFLETPLPEGYVLPPTHQGAGGGGPYIVLNRSPTPPPLIPITWVEAPTEPVADPSDMPEYVGLADLVRFKTE